MKSWAAGGEVGENRGLVCLYEQDSKEQPILQSVNTRAIFKLLFVWL